VIIHAVPAEDTWIIMDDGMPCGKGWRTDGAICIVLQNIYGMGHDGEGIESKSVQARRMIERAEQILRVQGVTYRNVARTWFYLSDILNWYPEFNKARSEKYGEFGIMPGPCDRELLLLASTGISGATPSSSACTMDLFAIAGLKKNRPVSRQLSSPRQLDAFRNAPPHTPHKIDNSSFGLVSLTTSIEDHES
jgi:hypothetical protein